MVESMEKFNQLCIIDSIFAILTIFGGIGMTILLFYVSLKFLYDLKADIKDSVDRAISKSENLNIEIDRKKINDAIIKKFLK